MPEEANHLQSSMTVSNAAVIHLNHLGLPVRDERWSQQFYSAYFGFTRPALRSMRTAPSSSATQLASTWRCTHSGMSSRRRRSYTPTLKARKPAEVRTLMERMETDGGIIVERNDEAPT